MRKINNIAIKNICFYYKLILICSIYSFYNATICINASSSNIDEFTSITLLGNYFNIDENYKNYGVSKSQSEVCISSAKTISSKEILVIFNDEISTDRAVFQSVDFDWPLAGFSQQSPVSVLLTFADDLPDKEMQTISYYAVEDKAGNLIWGFYNFIVDYGGLKESGVFGSVVFSEIMANPNGAASLPEVEYIEICNRSDKAVSLNGYKYYYNLKGYALPDIVINAGEFIAFCNAGKISQFDEDINIYPVTSFPVLNNTGKLIHLENKNGDLIHFAEYSNKWYRDKDKSAGGFSLEVIDINNVYPSAANWIASNDPSGGTPGRANSVCYDNPDEELPYMKAHYIDKFGNAEIAFSKNMDASSVNGIDLINNAPNFSSVSLDSYPLSDHLSAFKDLQMEEIDEDLLFSVNIDGIRCISGNSIYSPGEIEFGTTILPEEGDVKISEILFNASADDMQFIELYNASNKFIDLRNVCLSVPDSKWEISSVIPLSSVPAIFEPGKYLIVSLSPQYLFEYFGYLGKPRISVPSKMPSLNKKSGKIAVTDADKEIIESFEYNESLHTAKNISLEDVSLERISFSVPASVSSNWYSGNETDNFATPGYRNTETGATSVQDTLKIGKERFSLLYPYMKISEGYPQSLVTINYSLENDGNMIDMSVFSSKGIEVVRPYSNFEIGSYGSLFVDIISLSERRIVPGIYILYIRCRTGEDIIEKKIVCPFVP